jgi:hypothetical protein
MAKSRDDRVNHLTPETVEEYFRAAVPAAIPISAKLDATLEIDPRRNELLLVAPALGADPDLAQFERISVERLNVVGKQGDWFRLTVDATSMHYEAYALIESIVVQLEGGATFRNAVSESLEGFKELLSSRRRMTDERETGLIGELLVLAHLIRTNGEQLAIASWFGPFAEEHDFKFESFDAEVKTTRSERRVHLIGTETQLQPGPERPLYLVSVQITPSVRGAGAFTLAELVDRIRKMMGDSSSAFESGLAAAGWVDAASDLYRSRFQVRSVPRAYLVDANFPAITSAQLEKFVPQRTLVSGVSYRVDVSHLPFENAPAPLDKFSEEIR